MAVRGGQCFWRTAYTTEVRPSKKYEKEARVRNDRISPRRGTRDFTTTDVIGEGGLEDALAGMTERAERKIRAGATTLTTNKASGSGAGTDVIARVTGNVVVAGDLELKVVNTHTGLLVDGVGGWS